MQKWNPLHAIILSLFAVVLLAAASKSFAPQEPKRPGLKVAQEPKLRKIGPRRVVGNKKIESGQKVQNTEAKASNVQNDSSSESDSWE